jgi:hypothetical protein
LLGSIWGEYVWGEVPPREFDFLHAAIPGRVIIAPSAKAIIIFENLLFCLSPFLIIFVPALAQPIDIPSFYPGETLRKGNPL